MTLDTNLSTKPYFDDFDASKEYYRVLYKPSNAVQVRELNQSQTILQNQIETLGRNIFKDGSVVEGCAFTFDNNYNYVKINDTYANGAQISNISSLVGSYVTNALGLQGLVVNTSAGYQSQDPNLNTLYVKYLNSAPYVNGASQSVYSNADILSVTTSANVSIGTLTVATVANSTGKGYAFTTTSGVIFKKGVFLTVDPQTIIVSKYSNVPDAISVGFSAVESIVTSDIDTSLLDNASGSPNYTAPGADRLKIVPTLITRNSADISNSTTFFSLCDFKNGLPITIKNDIQLSTLGAEEARRTYETNGDYVTSPFALSVNQKTDSSGNANSSYNSLVVSPGIGYVKGNRVEFINNNIVDSRMGTDYESISSQIVSSNFGNYFNVTQYCGDFNNENIVQVELHNVAKNAITSKTFLGSGYSSSTKVGTAFIRGVGYSSGTPGVDAVYKIYLFNVQMLPGHSSQEVRSVIYFNSTLQAVADVVLTYNATLSAYVAQLQDVVDEIMVHPFGQKAMKYDGFSATQYVYRNRATASFLTTGVMSITLGAVSGTGSEQFLYQGTYSSAAESSYIVIPTVTGYSSNKTGTVAVSSGSIAVNGTSTAFLTDYAVGDYIFLNGEPHRVFNIVSNALMYVDTVFLANASGVTHQKTYPAGVPINFQNSVSRTISATSSVSTLTLSETLTSSFSCNIYFDVLRSSTVPIKKYINKSTFIKINVATNPAGSAGPWCLGIPDVLNLNHVYVSTTGTYSNTNPDIVSQFKLDNGQRDGYYGLAYISTGTPLSANASLLVSVDNFTYTESQGHGFFTAASYPIDDVNTANTQAIQTYSIPVYSSQSSGDNLDLRDSVDFRPYTVNTAVTSNVISSATINPANSIVISVPSAGSYLPSPDSNFQSNIQHYLPRNDIISISTSGQIIVTEGIPSNIPVTPVNVPGSMIIGNISVSPYPSLAPAIAQSVNRYDYAIQLTPQQNKRYTMSDVGSIDKRVNNLEYYTALSLLEQATSALQVRSSTTGQNAYQNGILVEPFKDFTISATADPQYQIAIDTERQEARPYFDSKRINLKFDPVLSTNIVQTGKYVTLPFNSVVYQQQVYASRYRNCIEGNIYNYTGTLKLDPPGIVEYDNTVNPVISGSVTQSANWTNLNNNLATSWGTAWAAWTPNSNNSVTSTSNTISQTVSTQASSQLSNIIASGSSSNVISSVVSSSNILPYVGSAFVIFAASGMKPNTILYPYFNNVPVSALCMPAVIYTGTVTISNGVTTASDGNFVTYDSFGTAYKFSTASWGTNITSDSAGNVFGIFYIPKQTFHSGNIEFLLADVSNITTGYYNISSSASATFVATPLAINTGSINSQAAAATAAIQQASIPPVVNVVPLTTPTADPPSVGWDNGFSNP